MDARTKPTEEQARDYANCVKTLQYYYSNSYPKGVTPIGYEDAQELEKRVEHYESLHLDMRDVAFMSDEMKMGLRRVTGELLVPALDWLVTERYDYIENIRGSRGRVWCVPVRNGNRYALREMDGKGTLVTDFVYDRMYRYFGGHAATFVVERHGKRGLVAQSGRVIIPCEMLDMDGIVPFRKSGKWGMAFGTASTKPLFDELDIRSEMYARGRIGAEWFWVDGKGIPTTDRQRRFFGSWYDAGK